MCARCSGDVSVVWAVVRAENVLGEEGAQALAPALMQMTNMKSLNFACACDPWMRAFVGRGLRSNAGVAVGGGANSDRAWRGRREGVGSSADAHAPPGEVELELCVFVSAVRGGVWSGDVSAAGMVVHQATIWARRG